MISPRSSEEQWELLAVTIELASGFEVLFVACASDEVRSKLRARLRHECERNGRPFLEPEKGDDGLDWLTRLRGSSTETEGLLPVLFFPLPAGQEKETFILHRLNENRDNLRNSSRGARGLLVLAGGPALLKHAANEAPDLWSIRTRSFELSDLALPPDLAPGLSAELPSLPEPEEALAEPPKYGAFLSCAFRDRQPVRVLRDALRLDGIGNTVVDREALPDDGIDFATAAVESRILVLAMSPDFINEVWPRVEPMFADDPDGMRHRVVLLKVRPCVTPAPLRSMTSLDWTTAARRALSYRRLIDILGAGTGTSEQQEDALESRTGDTDSEAPSAGQQAHPSVRPAGVDLVAEKTAIYSPVRRWILGLSALGLAVLLVMLAKREYDSLNTAHQVFPGFGFGTRSISQSVEGVRISVRKPFGFGSVDLTHPDSGSAVNLAVQADPGKNGVFEVVLIDSNGWRALYLCEESSPLQWVILGRAADSPAAIDLSHVQAIEVLLLDPSGISHVNQWKRIVSQFFIPRLKKERPAEAPVCPLVDTSPKP